MKQYDYLIVGAGLYGAVFAHEAKKAGKRCLVLDKRGHIAGNIYTEPVEGINVHRYGAHIFHTNNKAVWQYVNQFAEFNRYTNSPVANYHGEIYNMPFNMNTFNKMWGVVTPAEARAKIEQQKAEAGITEPKNLEEQAISLVGTDIYEKLVKGYTGKQWGRPCTELPAFIIKRLPVRFTYDNNYFNALYQGIPNGGYTALVEKMLDGVEVRLNVDYLAEKASLDKLAEKVVYTGPVDAYFGYQLGALQYRSVRFETEVLGQGGRHADDLVIVLILEPTHNEIALLSGEIQLQRLLQFPGSTGVVGPVDDDHGVVAQGGKAAPPGGAQQSVPHLVVGDLEAQLPQGLHPLQGQGGVLDLIAARQGDGHVLPVLIGEGLHVRAVVYVPDLALVHHLKAAVLPLAGLLDDLGGLGLLVGGDY